MGRILNPTNNNSFIKLVNCKATEIFVDKTDFIEKLNARVDTVLNFVAVTRPRRFGKTVTAQMLLAYYSKAYAGQNIFDTLKITNKEYKDTYEKHLNKYDVIYIDMNVINGLYQRYLKIGNKVSAVETLVDYLEYSIIEDLRECKEFADCFEKHQIQNIGLLDALSQLNMDFKKQFIFIMDEWDLIYRDYREDSKLQKDFIDLLRDLFKSTAGQACFSLVYLTGILPIKKYNSQSALNEFKEYNMLSPEPYEKYFGFTEDEIANIIKLPQCNITYQELKDWYKGYKLNGIDIYNPNSVVSAINDGICQSYWSHTASNEEVVRLININFKGIKTDITKLIDGIKIPFNSENFQNDMVTINDKNDIFSLLVCLGYLGCIEISNGLKQAYVPNREIKQALLSIVKSQKWSKRTEIIKRSEMLLKAIIKKQEPEKVAQIIEDIHNSSAVSLLDYNTEESLTYCVMTALQWSTMDIYAIQREEQSGKGRVDLVYIPLDGDYPLIIIEFKYGKSAQEAIDQIKTQQYYKRYTEQYRNIILVGINYSKTTKEHECLIEKL